MTQTQSIKDFCKLNNISRSLFYKLQRQGLGPQIMKVGRRTLITENSSTEWRKLMEAKSNI